MFTGRSQASVLFLLLLASGFASGKTPPVHRRLRRRKGSCR